MANEHRVIEIRPIRMDDCTEDYVSWLNNPRVNQFLETRHEKQTLAKVRDYVRSMLKSDDQHLYAILSNAKHVGNIKLGPINRHHKYAHIAYFIGNPQYWNQGIASTAIALMCEIGFTTLGLYRIEAGIYNSNAGSRAALIKCGFSEDGCLHKQLMNDAGMREDHVLFGLNIDDWKAATSAKPS